MLYARYVLNSVDTAEKNINMVPVQKELRIFLTYLHKYYQGLLYNYAHYIFLELLNEQY